MFTREGCDVIEVALAITVQSAIRPADTIHLRNLARMSRLVLPLLRS